MAKAKVNGKVSPEAMQIILLDEIAGRLADLKKHMEWAQQGGMIHPLSETITAAMYERTCSPPWYSATIFNDGPNPVYPDVNRDNNARNLITPLNMGDQMTMDFEQPKIKVLFMRCAVGQTANIRLFGTW